MRRCVRACRLWSLLPLALIGLSAETPPAPYQAGQVWEYQTRPGDEGSLLKIQSIDSDPAYAKVAPIYHITVIGVHFHGSPMASAIQHLPVSRHTLDESVTHIHDGEAEFPSADDGIAQWRSAKGGVFTIAVAEIIEVVDKTALPPPVTNGGANQN
jgi:hypothetical protein